MDTDNNDPTHKLQKLAVLAELRRAAKLNQAEVAQFFGVRRETISEWENGIKTPQLERRETFLRYCLELLNLKERPETLRKVWADVAVGVWKWRPLEERELLNDADAGLEAIPDATEEVIAEVDSSRPLVQPAKRPLWHYGLAGIGLLLAVIFWFRFSAVPEPIGVFDIISSSGSGYQVGDDPLQEGSIVYTDRNFFFTEVPATFDGATYILMANGDKRQGAKGEEFELTFKMNRAATVCIGYDRRFSVAERPAWLSAYTLQDGGTTELKFTPPSGDFTTTLHLYCADHAAGEVTLGANMTPQVEDADNKTMYTVVIR